MWPFRSHDLFPPPTEAWLQRASSDPEAQGWGAWSQTEKTPPEPECGDRKEEEEAGKAEDDNEDKGFPLFLLEREGLDEDLVEHEVPDQRSLGVPCLGAQPRAACWQELEAIKLKLWAMEQVLGPELPKAQGQVGKEEGVRSVLAQPLLSPQTGVRNEQLPRPRPAVAHTLSEAALSAVCPCPVEKVEMDLRSVFVGNVDYGGTAEELEAYFNLCGEVQRVTILCDKFSGHPKGYAYIEFATERSAQAAVEMDESVFRGRVIKVLPKRTNLPGISSTDRGGLQGHPGARGTPFSHISGLQGRARFRPRGQSRARGRVSPFYSPY